MWLAEQWLRPTSGFSTCFVYPLQGVVGSLIFQPPPSVFLRWQPKTDAALMGHTSVTNTPTFLDSWEVKTQGLVYSRCVIAGIECVPPKSMHPSKWILFLYTDALQEQFACFRVSGLCRLIIELFRNQMETHKTGGIKFRSVTVIWICMCFVAGSLNMEEKVVGPL